MRIWMLALLLAVPSAFAGTATITWNAPTTNVDGTAITAPITYKVYGAQQGTTKALLGAATALTFTHTPPGGATWCYDVTASVGGLESAHSAEGCKMIPASPPNAPTNVTIAVVLGLNMAPVLPVAANGSRGSTLLGFVPVGVECTGTPAFTYRGKTWRRITGLPVKWWASTPTANAAAPCS